MSLRPPQIFTLYTNNITRPKTNTNAAFVGAPPTRNTCGNEWDLADLLDFLTASAGEEAQGHVPHLPYSPQPHRAVSPSRAPKLKCIPRLIFTE